MARAFKRTGGRIVSIFFYSRFRVLSTKQKEGAGGELDSSPQT
jgi:hypothetical protein